MKRSSLALVLVLGSLLSSVACDSGDGDDIETPLDAPATNLDGAPGDGSGGACLPEAVITCTVGNDAPCAAACASSTCYNFNQLGPVCTMSCSPGGSGECPSTWTCNGMGRCRPPN